MELNKKVKDLSKLVEDMHMSINEKEAEVIRLTLCLGDEKKRNSDLTSSFVSLTGNYPTNNLNSNIIAESTP